MRARLVTIQVQPGKMEETIRVYRDAIVPAGERQPGFKGALLLTDEASGKGVSIFLWETEDDRAAGEASPELQEAIRQADRNFSAPRVRELFDVSVTDAFDRP